MVGLTPMEAFLEMRKLFGRPFTILEFDGVSGAKEIGDIWAYTVESSNCRYVDEKGKVFPVAYAYCGGRRFFLEDYQKTWFIVR